MEGRRCCLAEEGQHALNKDMIWKTRELIEIEMNDELQLELCSSFLNYRNEYLKLSELPRGGLGEVDREVLYCMVRYFKPSRIIEISSGASTYINTSLLTQPKFCRIDHNQCSQKHFHRPSKSIFSV